MVRGRIETTPSEQMVALRKARDRYAALADRFKDSPDSVTTRLEDHQRERDARRIASAYDKSIANMAAKMVRAGMPSRTVSFINNLGMARPLFAVAIGVLALAALLYLGLFVGPRANMTLPPHVVPPQLAAQPQIPAIELAPAVNRSQPLSRTPSATNHAPATLRPTAVAEQARPLARPVGATRAQMPENDETGFVAKVLQPDGSFKDVHFPATPRR